jgi:hypothetical protein
VLGPHLTAVGMVIVVGLAVAVQQIATVRSFEQRAGGD